ncbi:putative mitochondrial pyruvate carrier [Helianthus annuus]|nr:putative mitochondrial pyruvate carrier [Helianthus annuus]
MHVFIVSDMIIIIKFINITFGLLEVVMCVFSALCMRFVWMVQPRNYLLLVCHASR